MGGCPCLGWHSRTLGQRALYRRGESPLLRVKVDEASRVTMLPAPREHGAEMDAQILRPVPPPKPSGKREQTKVQNRQLILEAAPRVFAEMAFGAATVRDIIRATPLASGTFYNYFKSKEEVYEAIQTEVALVIRPRLRDERNKAATVEEFISGTFRTFFEFVTR